MALKKSELYFSLWQSCDELRGSMDASQYKDYVLVLLFVKYISDKYVGQTYAPITIPKGSSFADMVALKGTPDIGEKINTRILAPIAEANNLSDMPDFNDPAKLGDGKEKVERLTNLIAIFENPALNFSKNKADGDDLLGDAYEYLMRHFASESGKSKGQFYTPAEVSRVIAQMLGIRNASTTNDTTVYDPTCGSGSLLLKIGDEAQQGQDVKVTLFGQEKDNATAGLARMNMYLHDYASADIKQGNTLANPLFKDGQSLKLFDYVVANPPFSDKRWRTGLNVDSDPFERFEGFGIPPAKQGDYAYLLHIIRSMKSTGKGACILPHGVLFRGNAESAIRKNLIKRGYIKGIIGLPSNLFYGTPISACIILLDKSGISKEHGIFMINASRGFRKDGAKNRLREQDIHKIVDTFNRQLDIPGYSRIVSMEEIVDPKNDFSLDLSRYIDTLDKEDEQDLKAHLEGGIPICDIDALSNYWKEFPSVRNILFESTDRTGYINLKTSITEVKSIIYGHQEFEAFNTLATNTFLDWKKDAISPLMSFAKNGYPKKLIEKLSENLLISFEHTPLIDSYDIYQHLMDYWNEVMQDDCYLIADLDWQKAAEPREIFQIKNKDGKLSWVENHDYKKGKRRFKSDLIPVQYLTSVYFSTEIGLISKLELEINEIEIQLEERIEEHGQEEGLLSDVVEGEGDKQKIIPKSIKARLKEIKEDSEYQDEAEMLIEYSTLLDNQAEIKQKLREVKADLEQKIENKYKSLNEEEIKKIVIYDKWLASLESLLQSQLDQVPHILAKRIEVLADRYSVPLPQIKKEVLRLSELVEEHLKKIGIPCR